MEKHRVPVRLKLAPGLRGTKKMERKYGDSLVCVRYRYDQAAKKRYKTVELVEVEVDWNPEAHQSRARSPIPTPSDKFGVRVFYDETELRSKVKQVGGIWRPKQKVWELTYAQICALGLESRIVRGD